MDAAEKGPARDTVTPSELPLQGTALVPSTLPHPSAQVLKPQRSL